jgi:hypothetical protein
MAIVLLAHAHLVFAFERVNGVLIGTYAKVSQATADRLREQLTMCD